MLILGFIASLLVLPEPFKNRDFLYGKRPAPRGIRYHVVDYVLAQGKGGGANDTTPFNYSSRFPGTSATIAYQNIGFFVLALMSSGTPVGCACGADVWRVADSLIPIPF